MITFLLGYALAADPIQAVRRVQEVALETPGTYDFIAGGAPVQRATLLVVQLDPAWARPRQTAQPMLQAGAWPVRVVAADPATGCVAGYIPERFDRAVPLFIAGFGRPEAWTRAQAEGALTGARQAGLSGRPSAEIDRATRPPATLHDVDALLVATEAALAVCR